MRSVLLALCSVFLWAPPSAAKPTETTTVELSGLGVKAELPVPGSGSWHASPRLAASETWSPQGKLDPGATRTIAHLRFNDGTVDIFSAQVYAGHHKCESELSLRRNADQQPVRRDIPGWAIEWQGGTGLVGKAVGCHTDPRGANLAITAVYQRPRAAQGLSPAGVEDSMVAEIFTQIGTAVDDLRVFDDRALVHPSLEAKSRNLDSLTLPVGALAIDLKKAGQLVALLDPAENSVQRLMPIYPDVALGVKVLTSVPGNMNCLAALTRLTAKHGGQVADAPGLPSTFAFRKISISEKVVRVCEDFTGGVQLIVSVLPKAPVDVLLQSAAPLLVEIHRAAAAKYTVSAVPISTPKEIVVEQSRRRQVRGGWVGSTLGVSLANVDGGAIDDTQFTSSLHYLYHFRVPGESLVGLFSHGDLQLGFGTKGGFLYDVHFDPYGLALGSHRYYLGFSPGLGLSGWTGDRLEYAWQAGIRAVAVATFGDFRLIANARAMAVTVSQRQDGSDLAPIGDELAAGIDLLRLGGPRGTTFGLGAIYREARGAQFLGASVWVGFGSGGN